MLRFGPALALVLAERVEDLDEPEIDLPPFHVDAHHLDANAVAEPVHLLGVLAAQRVRRFEEAIVVVGHARDVDESLDEVLGQLDEQPERGHAGDVAVELVADLVGHEADLLPLHQLPLRIVGAALHLGGVARDFRQVLLELLGHGRHRRRRVGSRAAAGARPGPG